MDYIDNQSRNLLAGCLKAAGFSAGEAESRAEALAEERDLEYMLRYLHEHRDASVNEIRMIHTGILHKNEAIRIHTKKKKDRLADRQQNEASLIIRAVQIDWENGGRDEYLNSIGALKNLDVLELKKPVTFFVGENGSGKSTLLEAMAIAYGFNPEGGTMNYHFSTSDTHSNLHESIRLIKGTVLPPFRLFLRAESFYNMATKAEEYEAEDPGLFARYGGKSFHQQSHGESFAALLETDIKDNGLYFLDEPEAALSPGKQLQLLSLMYEYAQKGAQFIVATHSPILLALPDACIYEFSDRGIREKNYEETDVYRIVSELINHRDRVIGDIILNGKKYE